MVERLGASIVELAKDIAPTRTLVLAIALVSGLIGYLPDNQLSALQLLEFEQRFGDFARILFLIAVSLTLVSFSGWAMRGFNGWFSAWGTKRKAMMRLPAMNQLSDEEQGILVMMFALPDEASELLSDNHPVKRLVSLNLIETVWTGITITRLHEKSVYKLTETGELFLKKNSRVLAEKFVSSEALIEFVNPFFDNSLLVHMPKKFG